MTLLAQLPYTASQHGLHYTQRSAGFQMAVPLIQYQRSRITFEFSLKRTSLLAHQTPLRQSLSPIGVSGFIRPLHDRLNRASVFELEPNLRTLADDRTIPHIYSTIRLPNYPSAICLCLYHPDRYESPFGTLLSDTLVPCSGLMNPDTPIGDNDCRRGV